MPQDQNDVRFVGRIPGRYTIPVGARNSKLTAFACRTQGVTPYEVTVCAPVCGEQGDIVHANFDGIGKVHGLVDRNISGGFSMVLDPEKNDFEKLAMRIAWIKKKWVLGVPDNRNHKRVIPQSPHSFIFTQSRPPVNCFIIDMSCSGVAVSADVELEIGTPLSVGTVLGRVVRQLDAGFAVKFFDEQPMDVLEQRLTRLPDGTDGLNIDR